MESISELVLQGHFEKLKQEANTRNLDDQPLTLLMKALAYLEKVDRNGALDHEGQLLIHQLRGYSSKSLLLEPKPMSRAKGKSEEMKQTGKKAI